MAIIDILLSAWDRFLANRQIGTVQSRGQTYRVFKTQQPQTQKPRPVALFGASPDGFALDYVTYRSAKVNGPAVEPQPLQTELKSFDSDPEKPFTPDPNMPSMIGHGKKLNYSNQSDQRAVNHFSGETTAEAWDGIVRANEPKRSLETSRRGREQTEADRQGQDLKRYPFDFSS